jgi:hypothetical protein
MSGKREVGRLLPLARGCETRPRRDDAGCYRQESNFFSTARGSLSTSLSQILTTW